MAVATLISLSFAVLTVLGLIAQPRLIGRFDVCAMDEAALMVVFLSVVGFLLCAVLIVSGSFAL